MVSAVVDTGDVVVVLAAVVSVVVAESIGVVGGEVVADEPGKMMLYNYDSDCYVAVSACLPIMNQSIRRPLGAV